MDRLRNAVYKNKIGMGPYLNDVPVPGIGAYYENNFTQEVEIFVKHVA
jgi:hypothetical protein